MRGYPIALLLLGSFTLACMCGGMGGGGGDIDDDPIFGEDSRNWSVDSPFGPSDDSSPPEPFDQPEICADYLACVAVATPEELPNLQDAYGEGGDCWTQDQAYADNCEAACEAAVAAVAAEAPFEAVCTDHLPDGCYASRGNWDFAFTASSGDRCKSDFPLEAFDRVLPVDCSGAEMLISETPCSSDKLDYTCEASSSSDSGWSDSGGGWYAATWTLTLDSAEAAHGTYEYSSDTCPGKVFQVTATKR